MFSNCFPFNENSETVMVIVEILYLTIFHPISPFVGLGRRKKMGFSLSLSLSLSVSRGWLGFLS